MAGAQTALKFLRQIRFLDQRNLVFVDCTFDANDSIPGFDEVSKNKWDLYVNRLSPEAVKGSTDGHLDLVLFRKSNTSDLPELYKLASCYCTATTASYKVEQAFSAYDDILDDKRRSLNQSTIKAFHFLNWNLRVQFSEEKKKDQPTPRVPPLVEQVPQTTLNETVKEQVPIGTPKVVPKEEMKQALHTEGMGKPNDQQRGTKRKMSADSGKTKKQKEMHGKSYRASLYGYTFSEMSSSTLSAKCTVECGINMTFPQHLRQRILLPFLCTKSLLYNFCLMTRRGLRETP